MARRGRLLPKIGSHLGDIAIVRSMQAWALVHLLAQRWTQIGRKSGGGAGGYRAEYR
ncbi:MAG TPA: hypothetical protein VGL72_15980 [Bryobacteraceae bacterium]|jgi:hypothetical protein